jgi:hypothetical protein
MKLHDKPLFNAEAKSFTQILKMLEESVATTAMLGQIQHIENPDFNSISTFTSYTHKDRQV